MKKQTFLALAFILLAGFFFGAEAQQPSRFLIKFRNKGTNPFTISNPASYLSTRSVARRTRYSIAIDSTDLPVTPRYVDSLRNIPTVVVLNVSKWLNQASIRITDTSAANIAAVFNKINSFGFAQAPLAIAPKPGFDGNKFAPITVSEAERGTEIQANVFNYGASTNQVQMHNGQFLHNIGLRGEGMIMGVLDAGFLNYLTVKAFDSARANGQILGTWDFVAGNASVNEDNAHGMQCFSVIAANIPGQFVGTAPKASFYLFRSEDAATEYPIEEHNWVCAAERVDSAGGDMISSSLGYTTFDAPFAAYNHTYAELNGNTTMAAIGADLAAKKGLIVVNSAGNEGNGSWGKIVTPADGDSVLAVGGVNALGIPASFTSRGPSSDGQVKPDVASQGVATTVQQPNNTIGMSNGTSFAAPNIAGLTACLWQGFPEYNNMKIINALRQAGSRATNPNDTIGYGIPDVRKALVNLLKDFTTISGSTTNCKTNLSWTTKAMKDMKFEVERRLPGETNFTKVGELFGTGSVFNNQTLQYADSLTNAPQTGSINYRIRIVADTTVTNTYSDILASVNTNLAAGCVATSLPPVNPAGTEITLAPNPARSNLAVKINTANGLRQMQIRVFNVKGQTVNVMNAQVPAGISTYNLSVSSFAAGKYFLSVYNEGKLVATREWMKL